MQSPRSLENNLPSPTVSRREFVGGMALAAGAAFAPAAAAPLKRVAAIKQGNPLDTETMIGAQASAMQMDKIMSYLELGKQEGAQVLAGGGRNVLGGELAGEIGRAHV